MNIANAAAWIATKIMIIQVENSNGSKKAVVDNAPVFILTMSVIPVSRKGIENSMSLALSLFIFNAVTQRSALFLTRS